MASDVAIMGKLLVAIGLVILIAGLMYPGADTPWNSFQTTLSGINWPTYNNPFSPQIVMSQLIPLDGFCYINPGGIGGCNGNTTTPVGCTFVNGQQCLVSDDEDTSYVVISGDTGNAGFQVNGTHDTFPDYSIQSVNMGVWCRSENKTIPLLIHFSTNTIAMNFYGACPVSNGIYLKLNGAYSHQIVSSPYGANYTLFVERNGTQPGGSARVTMIDLEVGYVQEQVTCAGNVFENTGCQIANFARTFVKFVFAFVNGLVFVVSIIAWIGFIIAIFFVAIIQTLVFLYALPGAPLVVQGIVSAIVTSLFGAAIFMMLKILRGGGP